MITDEMLYSAAAKSNTAFVKYMEEGYDPENQHTFSAKFERKMKRLIRKADHPLLYRGLRGVASILLAILIGGGTWLAVDVEARAAFIGWLREVYDNIFAYRLVSLGSDCFSRTIPTLWGVKPRKKQGELGYPFDLSRHNLRTVVNAITNDFDGYFNGLYFNKKLDVWMSNSDDVMYCHEPDCHENDKNTIITRFSERIDNLRKILNEDDKKAVFICRYAPELSPSDINVIYNLYNELYTSLQKYRKDRVFELLIVDTFGHLNKERLNPNINLLACPWFDYDYVWHYDECRYSKLGLKFELTFINHILNFLFYTYTS